MWTIGIKSGLITVLSVIAYGLIVQLMGLQHSSWGNLYYAVLALGIYSGHYYYKAANNVTMTYKQGLGLGGIVILFVGLANTLPLYLYTKFIDTSFILQLTETIQKAWQQKDLDEVMTGKVIQFIQHMNPELLSIGTFLSTILLGFALTLIIAVFSKRPPKASPK